MIVTGHNRGIFAQYSVSDMAMGSFLENVKNSLRNYDISLNTFFRLEFPGQDVLYFCSGNFFVKLQKTSVSWFDGLFCNSIIRQHALQTY